MKLKPCPFCGGQPSWTIFNGGYLLVCAQSNCFANIKIMGSSEKEVSNKWNTRAEDIERETLENRLKHLLQSNAVRLYDEIDPTDSGGYKRDISELDHLVFDSKREEKTAHWDINTDGFYPFCSHCGEAAQHMSRFCPNCGAKMITRRHGE